MCGVLGVISSNICKDSFYKGLNSINHRGPDSKGFFEYEKVKLGHKRLSIIDLDDLSSQPFIINDNIIIFNGEIYNYKELKQKLLIEGVKFKTKGDTEVLLQWLIYKGIDGVKDLEGMFSFAWLNTSNEKLHLCRDAIGIKPLYIYNKNNNLIFSSEIKSIFDINSDLKKIDYSCLTEYLLNGFIYEPETGFENIRKVQAGTYEIYDLKANLIEKKTYWDLAEISKTKFDKKNIEGEIKRSIESHLVSDVPVGLFFSGGIDSSIILTQTRNTILPVTVKSEEKEYDEAGVTSDYKYSKIISKHLKTNLESISIMDNDKSNEAFLKLVEEVAIGNEELMCDFTFQSSKILSESVKKRGLTVMISGMGADEIFGGYPRYKLVKYDNLFKIIKPFVSTFGRTNKWMEKKVDRFNSYYEETNFGVKYASLLGFFSRKEVVSLLKKDNVSLFENKINNILAKVNGVSSLKKAMYLDFFGFLSHNFSVADKSSMLASIELRVPLATKRLYELTWGSKDSDLVGFFNLKKPLRNFLLKYLPKGMVDRKKAGFNPPLDGLIRNLGKNKISEVYQLNKLYDLVDKNVVDRLINEHFSYEKNNTYKLYQLLHLSFWLKNYS